MKCAMYQQYTQYAFISKENFDTGYKNNLNIKPGIVVHNI